MKRIIKKIKSYCENIFYYIKLYSLELFEDITSGFTGKRYKPSEIMPVPRMGPPHRNLFYLDYVYNADNFVPNNIHEEPNPALVSQIIKLKLPEIIRYPSATPTATALAITRDYYTCWCGNTESNVAKMYTEEVGEPYDPKILEHFLKKTFKWIENVSEIEKSIRNNKIIQLLIYITVSPTHHSELMNPKIEKLVREKLYEEMLPMIQCLYSDIGNRKPTIIFSPRPTNTILEHFN